jgi:hypothetical protein
MANQILIVGFEALDSAILLALSSRLRVDLPAVTISTKDFFHLPFLDGSDWQALKRTIERSNAVILVLSKQDNISSYADRIYLLAKQANVPCMLLSRDVSALLARFNAPPYSMTLQNDQLDDALYSELFDTLRMIFASPV